MVMVIFYAGKINFEFYVLIVLLKFPTFLQAFVTSVHHKIKNKKPNQTPIIDTLKHQVGCDVPQAQVPICYPVLFSLGNGACCDQGDVNKATDLAEKEDTAPQRFRPALALSPSRFFLLTFLFCLPPMLPFLPTVFPWEKTFVWGPWDESHGVEGEKHKSQNPDQNQTFNKLRTSAVSMQTRVPRLGSRSYGKSSGGPEDHSAQPWSHCFSRLLSVLGTQLKKEH